MIRPRFGPMTKMPRELETSSVRDLRAMVPVTPARHSGQFAVGSVGAEMRTKW